MDHCNQVNVLLRSIAITMSMLLTTVTYSDELHILVSGDQNIHHEMIDALRQKTAINMSIIHHNEFIYNNKDNLHRKIIAVGTSACELGIKNKHMNDVIVCTLIPAQTYFELRNRHEIDINHQNTTAVFMDQPLERQILLARLVAPQAKNIGTVFGKNSDYARHDFERIGSEFGFITEHTYLSDSQNPVQILTPLIQRSHVFLAIPDSANFNRQVSRWSLYITLRNKIPLIGYSANYSEAGAVVALYSTFDQLASQAHQVLSDFSQESILKDPSYPNEFTVDINEVSARTLRLSLIDSTALTNMLKANQQ